MTQPVFSSKFDAIDSAKDTDIWTAELAEDATSKFHYFGYYFRGSDTAVKVRVLWNGGAQNAPTSIDFYMVSESEYKVVEREYDRKDLEELLWGANGLGRVTATRTLRIDKEELTKQMQKDLKMLLHAASMRQRPLP